MRDTYILYTYKYRRLETSPLISHKCHTKSLRKSHKNTSDRHGNNRFVKHTKFPTRFICYGKFLPHFKTKKSNIQIFANPTGLGIPSCYGRSTPLDFKSHPQFSLAESKQPSWQHEPVHGRNNHTHQGTHRQFALRQGTKY